jgi:hypothetical protein
VVFGEGKGPRKASEKPLRSGCTSPKSKERMVVPYIAGVISVEGREEGWFKEKGSKRGDLSC